MCVPAKTIVNQLTIARKTAPRPAAPLAAERRRLSPLEAHAKPDPTDQNQMRDRQNQPERRRQPVPFAMDGST